MFRVQPKPGGGPGCVLHTIINTSTHHVVENVPPEINVVSKVIVYKHSQKKKTVARISNLEVTTIRVTKTSLLFSRAYIKTWETHMTTNSGRNA